MTIHANRRHSSLSTRRRAWASSGHLKREWLLDRSYDRRRWVRWRPTSHRQRCLVRILSWDTGHWRDHHERRILGRRGEQSTTTRLRLLRAAPHSRPFYDDIIITVINRDSLCNRLTPLSWSRQRHPPHPFWCGWSLRTWRLAWKGGCKLVVISEEVNVDNFDRSSLCPLLICGSIVEGRHGTLNDSRHCREEIGRAHV